MPYPRALIFHWFWWYFTITLQRHGKFWNCFFFLILLFTRSNSWLTCGDRDAIAGVFPLIGVPALEYHAVLGLADQPVQHYRPPGWQEGVGQGGGGVPTHCPVPQLTLTHPAGQLFTLEILIGSSFSGQLRSRCLPSSTLTQISKHWVNWQDIRGNAH